MTTEQTPKAHLGRNVRHFRQEKDLSQEAFADLLGAPWSQKKVSQLENSAEIEAAVLEEIAKALEVSVEEIKEYSDGMVLNIQNNYDSASKNNIGPNYHECTFNPLDKLMESYDRLSESYAKIEKLNEALLKEKDEKIALLERMLKDKK